jgi:uncharacterized SAM-binding protein YcdF (DUF218 family)
MENHSTNQEPSARLFARGSRVIGIVALTLFLVVVFPQIKPEETREWATVLLLTGCLGVLLLTRKRRDHGWQCLRDILVYGFAGAGMLMVALAHLPLGAWLARPLVPVVTDLTVEPADAVVVLASGGHPSGRPTNSCQQRVLRGLELVRSGRAPRLIISTGTVSRPGRQESEAVFWLLGMCGEHPPASGTVPFWEIVIDDRITTTRTEATTLAARLLPQGIKRILLVTNGPHIHRATQVFRAIGFEVHPVPVQIREELDECLDHRLGVFDYAMHEWLGLVLYRLRGDFRSRAEGPH